MNYKETLYFISKCLTISLEESNRQEIKKQLQSKTIDWEAVVKVSTAHYVFPALYCNLKRVDFLKYLPQELVNYMEYITSLNRERNKQIITQAKDLNTLLLKNNITPIFLKGTGNLLEGLYEDIGERMVGDIDFLFSGVDLQSANNILKSDGYSTPENLLNHFPRHRHFPRLIKQKNIAALEIHKELSKEKKYANEFNYNFIENDTQIINGVVVLSYANQINLSIIANQINDSGFYYKTMALRNAYDVFLLSKKTNAKDAVNKLDTLNHPLNCFLAACYEVFNSVASLDYNNTKKTASYLSVFNSQLSNIQKSKKRHNRIKCFLYTKSRLNFLYKSLLYKEYRVWLFKIVVNKNWWKKKGIQLGFKQ